MGKIILIALAFFPLESAYTLPLNLHFSNGEVWHIERFKVTAHYTTFPASKDNSIILLLSQNYTRWYFTSKRILLSNRKGKINFNYVLNDNHILILKDHERIEGTVNKLNSNNIELELTGSTSAVIYMKKIK